MILPATQKRNKYANTARWIASHPEAVAGYDKKYLKQRAINNAERRRRVRKQAIVKLGGRCSSKTCKWVNEDGSLGCTDFRILQFDHVKGGGTKHRKTITFEALCRFIARTGSKRFQLLCANCNWIKAFEEREFIFRYDIGQQ